jgi:acetyl esterase/lipase
MRWSARAVFLFCVSSLIAVEPTVLRLWPMGAPEPEGYRCEPEKVIPPKSEKDVVRVTNVSDPTITVYRPENANGAAVLVCPGGGYSILAIEHEGTKVCEWLNGMGVTGILLKYRVPARPSGRGVEPLQDAQRAMGMIRKRASEWGLDPARIGVLGFSAGGHLTVNLGLNPSARTYRFDPALEDENARPDFMVPVYPAYLVDKGEAALLPEIQVTAAAPRAFFVHAGDDKGQTSALASAYLYVEYRKLGIPAELHVYSKGGHGFGMKKNGLPVNDWALRVGDWLKAEGVISPGLAK